MTTRRSDEPLDTMLNELGPADPPAEFTDSVLAKVARASIADARVHASGRVIPFSNGGISMTITKKAMWGLAAAAAVILAVFVARGGFPAVDRGTEGAIGAAKKYQAPQMTANDVVTGDAAAQEFFQSETFDRLIKDPAAVAMLSNARLREALREQAFADAIRSATVRDAMRSGLFARIFDNPAARAALEDALKANVSGAAIQQNAAIAALHPSMRADLHSALEDVNLRNALAKDAFRNQLADTGMRAMLSRQEFSAGINNANFVSALSARGFSAAVRSARFDSAIAAH